MISQDELPVMIMCQPQQQLINRPPMLLNATWFIDGVPFFEFSAGEVVLSQNTVILTIFDFQIPTITVSCAAANFPDEILATFTGK